MYVETILNISCNCYEAVYKLAGINTSIQTQKVKEPTQINLSNLLFRCITAFSFPSMIKVTVIIKWQLIFPSSAPSSCAPAIRVINPQLYLLNHLGVCKKFSLPDIRFSPYIRCKLEIQRRCQSHTAIELNSRACGFSQKV